MKQQDNHETNNQSIIIEGIIEDLSAPYAEEIKGGPTRPACPDCAAFDPVLMPKRSKAGQPDRPIKL